MPERLRLISHKLCPFVQRAVIVAKEKEIPFERVDIDLADKAAWFLEIAPTGKVPVLQVFEADGSSHVLFESSVIAEYLDEIAGERLLPRMPLERARERAWIEFASATIADIGRLYGAPTEQAYADAARLLRDRLLQLEQQVQGPWFGGSRFGLADAAFAPAFRYLDVFDWRLGRELVERPARVRAWSDALARRDSVRTAVRAHYPEQLIDFVIDKHSHLGRLLERHALELA